jgi:anti-anti-sigma regulatory factor
VITPTSILVGRIGKLFWLRVEGRGTFQDSIQVKRAFQSVIAAGTRDLVVDLERCPMMDSTFLGTLTGTALNLMEHGGGSLSVLNANQRNQQLLTELGLNHLLDLDVAGTAWPNERREACAQLSTCNEAKSKCKEENAQHVLDAHQRLADLNQENHGRFRDVIQFLEQEVTGARMTAAAT